jgi:hypothetical protein
VLSDELAAFLEGGCALIVGTVGSDGRPHSGRAWGIEVLDAEAGRLRLLLDAADGPTLANLAGEDPRLACTGADVRTLHSRQLKGRSLGTEPAAGADRARAARYCAAFFADIEATDGQPRELLEQIVPAAYVACTVQVDALYDQTPGPGAGAAVGGDAP